MQSFGEHIEQFLLKIRWVTTTIIGVCLSVNLRIKKYNICLLNIFYRVGTFKIEYINVIFLNFQKEKSDLCQI